MQIQRCRSTWLQGDPYVSERPKRGEKEAKRKVRSVIATMKFTNPLPQFKSKWYGEHVTIRNKILDNWTATRSWLNLTFPLSKHLNYTPKKIEKVVSIERTSHETIETLFSIPWFASIYLWSFELQNNLSKWQLSGLCCFQV